VRKNFVKNLTYKTFSDPLPFPYESFDGQPSTPFILFILQENYLEEIVTNSLKKWGNHEGLSFELAQRMLKYVLFNYKLESGYVNLIITCFYRRDLLNYFLFQEVIEWDHRPLDKESAIYSYYFSPDTQRNPLLFSPLEFACLIDKYSLVRELMRLGVKPNSYILYPPALIANRYSFRSLIPLCQAGANIEDKLFLSQPKPEPLPIEQTLYHQMPDEHIETMLSAGAGFGRILEFTATSYKDETREKRFDFLLEKGARITLRGIRMILTCKKDSLDERSHWIYRKFGNDEWRNLLALLPLQAATKIPACRLAYLQEVEAAKAAEGSEDSERGIKTFLSRVETFRIKLIKYATSFYYKPGGPGSLQARENFYSVSRFSN